MMGMSTASTISMTTPPMATMSKGSKMVAKAKDVLVTCNRAALKSLHGFFSSNQKI